MTATRTVAPDGFKLDCERNYDRKTGELISVASFVSVAADATVSGRIATKHVHDGKDPYGLVYLDSGAMVEMSIPQVRQLATGERVSWSVHRLRIEDAADGPWFRRPR